jgi:ferritin-like metal-binding protein YciE
MTTDSIEQLLVEGVQELYYTEQQLVDALEMLADQTNAEAASKAFSEHRAETQNQVDRLERVFEALGEEPEQREDIVVTAMIDEHEQFAQENDGEVLDRYNMAVGQKTEHYEIAAYGNLASLAEKTGQQEAAELLVETLREEEDALEQVTQASERYDEQQIASD